MKKRAVLGLSLCVALTGCTFGAGNESGTEQALAVKVAEEKMAYYRQLATALQEELIGVRAEYYERCMEYESRIAALEAATGQQEGTQAPSADADAPEAERETFRFRIENGSATLIAYTGKETDVRIPSHTEGVPVTAIGDRAFENNLQIESVAIPDGVLTLGWFAFSGCIRLASVSLPESVRSISYGAFANCNAKLAITCTKASYAAAYAASYGIEVRYT